MGLDADLRTALDTRLFAVSGIPDANHRAGENAKFDPTVREPWVRRVLVYGSRERITAPGQGAFVQEVGLYLVDTFHPELTGITTADALARLILLAFPPGLGLMAGTVPVTVEYSLRRGGFRDTGFWRIPMEIKWWLVTENTVA